MQKNQALILLAQAFIIGEEFIGNDDVSLVLVIISFMVLVFRGCCKMRKNVAEGKSTVFGCYVNDPER